MNSLVTRRLGYCHRWGNAVQKVDPAFLFVKGDECRAVTRLREGMDAIDAWFLLYTTSTAVDQCVNSSVYSEHFHHPLIHAATELRDAIERVQHELAPDEGEGVKINQWQVINIQNKFSKFETILVSELQSISSYLVTRKGGFDISAMVDAGHVFFSKELELKVPEAKSDLVYAMRCIAFEIPPAAGFHLHRANEAVLRRYWDAVTGGAERPKERELYT